MLVMDKDMNLQFAQAGCPVSCPFLLVKNLHVIICFVHQARIYRFLEKTKKKKSATDKNAEGESDKNTTDKKPEGESDPMINEQRKLIKEQENLRKRVTKLMKKQKVHQVRGILKEHDDSKPWGQEAHVKVCDVCACKCGCHIAVVVFITWCLYFPGWLPFNSIVGGNSLYTTSNRSIRR